MRYLGFWASFSLGFALIPLFFFALALVGWIAWTLDLRGPQTFPFAMGCATSSVLLVTAFAFAIDRWAK